MRARTKIVIEYCSSRRYKIDSGVKFSRWLKYIFIVFLVTTWYGQCLLPNFILDRFNPKSQEYNDRNFLMIQFLETEASFPYSLVSFFLFFFPFSMFFFLISSNWFTLVLFLGLFLYLLVFLSLLVDLSCATLSVLFIWLFYHGDVFQ